MCADNGGALCNSIVELKDDSENGENGVNSEESCDSRIWCCKNNGR